MVSYQRENCIIFMEIQTSHIEKCERDKTLSHCAFLTHKSSTAQFSSRGLAGDWTEAGRCRIYV
ncbi:MAG TPA: hypothetical protein DF613_17040 [Lachnospiraceae bacterium]|nr:hypothetical protein [Lachnospiraceae bacterium]